MCWPLHLPTWLTKKSAVKSISGLFYVLLYNGSCRPINKSYFEIVMVVITGWFAGATVPFESSTGVLAQIASTTSIPLVT